MRRVLFVLICVLFAVTSRAEIVLVSDLISDFRILTGEIIAEGSIVVDSEIVVFLDRAQDKIVRLGGYLEKSYDIVHSEDSTNYGLPSKLKKVVSVIVFSAAQGNRWWPVLHNPDFAVDVEEFHYFIRWDTVDSPRLYLQANIVEFVEEDTIRVIYKAEANDLDATTDTCEVTSDLQTFIIEEAIALHERSKRNFTGQQQIQTQTRVDIGIIKQVEQ